MSQEIVTTGGENATPIVQWDPNSGAPLPAYLTEAQDELGTNIPDRQTVPSLSYEGKIWAVVINGERHKLQITNGDGDTVPVPIMRAVILNFNGDRGRAYYPGVYNPAASTPPLCWSADGVTPDVSVKEKQSPTCAACPMAVKGSKVQDGKEMVACSQHRMVALVPAHDITHPPLRLKLAVTSDWDKEIVEHGWYAFRQYCDFLKSRGVTHTGLVVTKMKFDHNTAFPKVLFALDRVLSPNELPLMREAAANPKVAELLSERWNAAGAAGTLTDDRDLAPQPDLQTTIPDRPKPTDPGHIAHAGTDAEVWWDPTAGEAGAWVKPWGVAAAPPPPPPTPAPAPAPAPVPQDPVVAALEQGWEEHPSNPAFLYKGQEVVAKTDIAERLAAPTPIAAPAPEPQAPPPAAVAAPSGLEAALADGWIAHPSAPGYHYRGEEVVADGELAGRYPPASAATGAPVTDAGQTATTPASPSEGVVQDPEVAALLNKWTS